MMKGGRAEFQRMADDGRWSVGAHFAFQCPSFIILSIPWYGRFQESIRGEIILRVDVPAVLDSLVVKTSSFSQDSWF